MSAMASSVDTSRHSCECRCAFCEENGTGFFAQIAALRGHAAAAAPFGPRLAQYLAQAGERQRADHFFLRRRGLR